MSNKDAKAKLETAAAETPPGAPATDGTQETQIALNLIESLKREPLLPKIEAAPSLVPAIEIENPAPLAEAPKPAEPQKPVEISAPELIAPAPSLSSGERLGENTPAEPPRSSRFALLAASVAAAAAIGAMTGALAAAAIALSGTSPAPTIAPMAATDLSALHDTIGKMRTEIAALRTGVDTGARNSNAQFAKVAERFDRLERATAEAAKRSAGDVTGSVAPPPAASASDQAAQKSIVDGWVLRNVNRGVAYIQGRRMGVIEVERGDVVPGLGRIEAIRRQDGHWVVVTAKGLIVPPPR